MDAVFPSLQPVVVMEVLVLLQQFLLNLSQYVVAAHPHRNGLPMEGRAGHLKLPQASDRCPFAISPDGDEKDVLQGLPLEVPGHVGFCLVHHVLVVLLVEHHFDGAVALELFRFLLRDLPHPGIRD